MLGTTTVDHAIVSRGSHLVEEQHRSEATVALLSIRPEYVDLIREGGKRVEFRRRPFARTITHVVIYATSPVRKLVGICEMGRVIRDAPSALWSQYGSEGGISREALFRYLDGLTYGIAILLRPFRSFANVLDLSELGFRRPPQSFRYLPESALADLVGRVASLPCRSYCASSVRMRNVVRRGVILADVRGILRLTPAGAS